MICRRGTDEVLRWAAAPLNAGDPKEDLPRRDRIQRFVSRLFDRRQVGRKAASRLEDPRDGQDAFPSSVIGLRCRCE